MTMSGLNYEDFVRGKARAYELRLRMVSYALKHGVSRAAREFRTTRRTVYKWLRRYEEEGRKGLVDKKRAPKHIPHKTPEDVARRVVRLRERNPHMGPRSLKYYYGKRFNLPSLGAIYRILKQEGLIKAHRRTKKAKARDMREIKKALSPFQKCQVDTKDLSDIPNYSAFIKLAGYPRYQYTFRCVRTGAVFVGLAHSNNTMNSAVFLAAVLNHLKEHGLLPRVVQTDNGTEFVKIRARDPGELTMFQRVLEAFGVEHRTIPPGQKTYNSDVEAFHRLIEHEFYDVREYASLPLLVEKLSLYQEFFNLKRMNFYKGKTPWAILRDLVPKAKRKVLLLRPFIIEEVIPDISFPKGMTAAQMGVYYVARLITHQPSDVFRMHQKSTRPEVLHALRPNLSLALAI